MTAGGAPFRFVIEDNITERIDLCDFIKASANKADIYLCDFIKNPSFRAVCDEFFEKFITITTFRGICDELLLTDFKHQGPVADSIKLLNRPAFNNVKSCIMVKIR